jgi:ribosomal protein L29
MSEMINDIAKLKKKVLSLRIKKSSGDLVDTSTIKKTKKEVARLFTKKNKNGEK